MDLYLAVVLPEGGKSGKRIRLRNKWEDKVDYKKTYILFPTKPTDVPDDVAELLLEQDPHLVSKKPFSATETPSSQSNDEDPAGDENPDAEVTTDYEPILAELAERDFTKMKSTEIIEFGAKLGIEIDMQLPKAKKIAALEDLCEELAG